MQDLLGVAPLAFPNALLRAFALGAPGEAHCAPRTPRHAINKMAGQRRADAVSDATQDDGRCLCSRWVCTSANTS